jgi:hypothetical protein
MDIFSICLEELCGWLIALGHKSLGDVLSYLFHLKRSYVDYLLTGYLIILQRNEDGMKTIIENKYETKSKPSPTKQEISQGTIKSHETQNNANIQTSQNKIAKAPSMLLFGDKDKLEKPDVKKKIEPEHNPKLDPKLLLLSPHSLIERHEGILQKISDEYDETTKMIEIFLRTRRLMNPQSSDAINSLKDTLISLQNFVSNSKL